MSASPIWFFHVSSCMPKVFDKRYILKFYNLSGTPAAWAISSVAEGQPVKSRQDGFLEGRLGLSNQGWGHVNHWSNSTPDLSGFYWWESN